jgi:threonine/homoserine/homoserine lactone efflux protein
MISYLILGISLAFTAAIQPGPLQSYFLSRSLTVGWKRTIPAAFAPLISDGPIIIFVVILLSRTPAWLLNIMQCAGGFLLLYITAGIIRTWKNHDTIDMPDEHSAGRTLFQATMVNFLNPAPYLGWSLITGPLLIKGWNESPVNGIVLLTAFYSTLIITSIIIIISFASARKFGSKLTRALIGISSLVLGGFGIYQLWSGISFLIKNGV